MLQRHVHSPAERGKGDSSRNLQCLHRQQRLVQMDIVTNNIICYVSLGVLTPPLGVGEPVPQPGIKFERYEREPFNSQNEVPRYQSDGHALKP